MSQTQFYAPVDNLGHRITFELISEIGLAHRRLLSSKLGWKAYRNRGAIQVSQIRAFAEELHALKIRAFADEFNLPYWNPPNG